ncbi:MAG: hypothetical protein ACAI35_20255 [Candidatus Methylacidiphilales bacterium]|nr:hypothetical protein [Candidatus Methylacidiphilales bacterium]
MILTQKSKATLTAFHFSHGDMKRFTLSDGRVWEMTLLGTSAEARL